MKEIKSVIKRRKIVHRIKLVDYGAFYKWEIEDNTVKVTTQGFHSMTHGLKVLKKNINLFRKMNRIS